jgi:hypothetical protein
MESLDYQLTTNYLSEDREAINFIVEEIFRNKVTLITCPTGVGKTYFIQNYLGSNVATSHSAIAQQIEENSDLVRRYSRHIGQNLTFDVEENKQVATFASSDAIILDTSEIFSIDEVHEIVNYSDFAYSTVECLMKQIKKALDMGKRVVLWSGTSRRVIRFLSEPLGIEVNINIIPKEPKKLVDKVTVFVSKGNPHTRFRKYALDASVKEAKQGRRSFILAKTKMDVEYGANKINKELGDVTFVHSDKKDCANYKKMLETQELHTDVLIGTTAISNGININSKIENVFCAWAQKDLIIQTVSRIRKGGVHLHLPMMTEKAEVNFNESFETLKGYALKAIEDYNNNRIPQEVVEGTIGVSLNENGEYELNELAIKKFISDWEDRADLSIKEKIIEFSKKTLGCTDIEFIYEDKEKRLEEKENKEALNKDIIDSYLQGRKLIGATISREKRDEIIAELTGPRYNFNFKTLGPFLKKYGYALVMSNNKREYTIIKK